MERQPLVLPLQANETWSMDFVFDALSDGRKLKTLTIVDDCTKECVEIGVDTRINGEAVTRILDRAIRFRGKPRAIHTPGHSSSPILFYGSAAPDEPGKNAT